MQNIAELRHSNRLLRDEIAALKQAATKPKLNPEEQAEEDIRAMLVPRLDGIITAMLAVQKRQSQNEQDKKRVAELMRERGPYVQLPAEDPKKEKLAELDEERHEIGRRINFFPAEITRLGEAEQQTRKNFAGC